MAKRIGDVHRYKWQLISWYWFWFLCILFVQWITMQIIRFVRWALNCHIIALSWTSVHIAYCISHNDKYWIPVVMSQRFHGQVHFLLVHRPWTNDWINSTIRHYGEALLPLLLSLSLFVAIHFLHFHFLFTFEVRFNIPELFTQGLFSLSCFIDTCFSDRCLYNFTISRWNVPFYLLCTLQWL